MGSEFTIRMRDSLITARKGSTVERYDSGVVVRRREIKKRGVSAIVMGGGDKVHLRKEEGERGGRQSSEAKNVRVRQRGHQRGKRGGRASFIWAMGC